MNQTLLFTLNILLLNITGNRYLYTLTCLFDIIDSFIYVCVDSWKKGEKFENLIKQNLYQRAHTLKLKCWKWMSINFSWLSNEKDEIEMMKHVVDVWFSKESVLGKPTTLMEIEWRKSIMVWNHLKLWDQRHDKIKAGKGITFFGKEMLRVVLRTIAIEFFHEWACVSSHFLGNDNDLIYYHTTTVSREKCLSKTGHIFIFISL